MKDRVSLTIENGPNIQEELDVLRSRFVWVNLISGVTDTNGMQKDVIKNFRNLTAADMLRFNNKCLGNGLSKVPPTNRSMLVIDPTKNENNKSNF